MGKREEILYNAIDLRKRSEEIERNLQFVNEQVAELEGFEKGLEFLQNEEEKEILAPLGKGVFVKVEKRKSEKLFVDVGAGVLVRKTPEETRKVILEQMRKFKEAKIQLTTELEGFAAQFREMMEEVEKLKEGQ